MPDASGLNSVTIAEHIGQQATGDNIEAKRAANYQYSGSGWQREATPLIDVPYDYQAFSNPDASGNYQTIQLYQGGSGGMLVRTLSLTYDGSNNVTSIART